MNALTNKIRGSRKFPVALSILFCAYLPSMPAWAAGPITEFPIPATGEPLGITAGPDGNLWFCDVSSSKIGRITPQGVITEFTSPVPPYQIASGPDGNLWFTSLDLDTGASAIGRISTVGDVTVFPFGGEPCGIAAGPDGNLWFTSCGGSNPPIGRITTAGGITTFTLPNGLGHFQDSIVSGPDGNLWFTEPLVRQIGRMTTAGSVTEFPLPAGSGLPGSIVAGPDGNLWFTDGDKIGRISPGGDIAEFPIAATALGRGPDGNLWFANQNVNRIGRLLIDADRVAVDADLEVPTANAGVFTIAPGLDGNLWFTEPVGKIGRVDLSAVCSPGGLCLGRFKITAAWNSGASSGRGEPSLITSNAGYFWFSDPSNVEVFVKILNTCASSGTYDVYVNGLTHLGVTVTVTDTRTGISRDFVNPAGSPFSLIFDGSTFACP